MTARTIATASICLVAAACGGTGAVVVGSGGNGVSSGPNGIASIASSSGSAPAPVTSHTPAKMGVEVWLTRGGKLFPLTRGVTVTKAVIGAAVQALLSGPTRAERARSAVPAGTQLLGISLHGGVATVDLTSDFTAGGSAGSERLRLAQLVYTATQFHGVRGVLLHLDGAPVTALSDGLVLANPMTRRSMGFPELAPAISVTSPQAGATVQAPFTVRGVADVFEAGLTFKLLDASGHELSSGASAASCGTGCPGTFSFTIDELGISHIQDGTLVISSANASGLPDGGEHLRLPLVLLPPFNVTSPQPGATLTTPATIAVSESSAPVVLVRIVDAQLHVLARRVVHDACAGCYGRIGTQSRVRLPFSVAGLQQGYVIVSPLHVTPNSGGQVVEIPG
ncbi:MAG TPA: Gmad2 immunoglobulin-like domain-containing protein, partial [Gaiellales bacterium]